MTRKPNSNKNEKAKAKSKSKENDRDDVETTFRCETCSKVFPTKKGLRRHVMRNHRGIAYQCYYCDFTSKFKECIARHVPLHLVKKEVIRTHGAYVKCPLCEFGCVVREAMIKHYVDDHDVDMAEQSVEFPSSEDFLKWKYSIEQADLCQFTSRSKKNRGAVQVRYYRCFRDGIFQRKGKGIRNMKLKGSLKINGICPAGIKAEEDRTSGVVRVTFIRAHVGHSNELGLLNLSKFERAEIAEKLAMGMSHEDIIGSIRGSMDAEVKRVHLTTRKDLWNVQSSFGLNKKKEKYIKRKSKVCKTNDPADNETKPVDVPGTTEVSENIENQNTSGPCVMEITPDHVPQEHGASAGTVETQWITQGRYDYQETVAYYTQIVTEKPNPCDRDISQNMLNDHASACDSSNDKDDQYFEVTTPANSDGSLVPLEVLLNEKKTKIRSRIDDILNLLKTNEEADIFYNELLRIEDTILTHSSFPGNFNTS